MLVHHRYLLNLKITIKEGDEYTKHEPVKTWDYNDANGDLLGISARYEVNGTKEIRMWTYAARGEDAAEWGCGHFNALCFLPVTA